VTRAGLALGAVVLTAACASSDVARRGGELRDIVGVSVLLRAEREGGGRRAGSGVVVASDEASSRTWIVTTRHLLEPSRPQKIYVLPARGHQRLGGTVTAVSAEIDAAIVEVRGVALPAARVRDTARLGDEVRVVAFPFGRRLTVVSGIVSQIMTVDDDEVAVEGPVRLVDASVSYGASGGGVFDASTGALLGIVEGYRTARVTVQSDPERSVDIPVPGETTVVAIDAIRRFLEASGLTLAR
jgi:serine protease Do